MRTSHLFFQTLRTSPGDDRLPGRQFLARAGFLRPLGARATGFLPLGVSVQQRIERIARRRFEAEGAQEIALPQADAYGQDRVAAALALARTVIQSHRQLPAGLFEVERSQDADFYGLYLDAVGLDAAYPRLRALLCELLAECGVEALEVVAEGPAVGLPAHACVFPSAVGDRVVLQCPACGCAALQGAAQCRKALPEPETLLPVEDVATPDCKTMAELAQFLGIPESRTAKAVFLTTGEPERRFIFAVVRGDTDLNEAKLCRAVGAPAVMAATEEEIRRAGAEPGYGSPVGLSGVTVVVDDLAAASPNLVAGANRPGYHLRNVNYERDYTATLVADIVLARAGDPCPVCAGPMQALTAVELAHVSALGDAPARALGVTYLDREGSAQPLAVTHAHLQLGRMLEATAETHHDDRGLVWPPQLAPFQVYLMVAGKPLPEVTAAADGLYEALGQAGYDVLYDDRDERAGVKFNDADLLGIPVRVVVGERGLREGTVEVKLRTGTETEAVRLEDLPERLGSLLRVA
jgi:prolyl-tRNA synthetase